MLTYKNCNAYFRFLIDGLELVAVLIILLLRYSGKLKELAKMLARNALKDSCWQVKSAALLLLAAIEGDTLAIVPSAIYDNLSSTQILGVCWLRGWYVRGLVGL